MGSNLKDVYYCQQERTQELSDRMYSRNMPSHQLGAAYFARPVDTYATVMPMLDCRKPATVTKHIFQYIIKATYLIQVREHLSMDIVEMLM